MNNIDLSGEMYSFEDISIDNGGHYWYARDLMGVLGYKDFDSFKKAINKAHTVCNALEIDIADNIVSFDRDINGKLLKDYKLTRFACYLTVMNCDVKKPEVAKAQAYFAAMAELLRDYWERANQLERVVIREELTGEEKVLSGIAKDAGIDNKRYALFQNAGYRGMYNMNLSKLKQYKGLTEDNINRSLLDFMGRAELAANLFRMTQTSQRIRTNNLSGQKELEDAAEYVGRQVRKTMMETGGKKPEDLPLEEDIKQVKSQLKKDYKELKKIDEQKKLKKGKSKE
jgi:DNA-damage-inducible protein D